MLSALWGAEIPNGCWTVALLCHVWAVQCFKHDSMPQSSCLLWPGKIFDNMLLCDVFLTLDPVSVVNFTMQNCPRCASIASLAATEPPPPPVAVGCELIGSLIDCYQMPQHILQHPVLVLDSAAVQQSRKQFISASSTVNWHVLQSIKPWVAHQFVLQFRWTVS